MPECGKISFRFRTVLHGQRGFDGGSPSVVYYISDGLAKCTDMVDLSERAIIASSAVIPVAGQKGRSSLASVIESRGNFLLGMAPEALDDES